MSEHRIHKCKHGLRCTQTDRSLAQVGGNSWWLLIAKRGCLRLWQCYCDGWGLGQMRAKEYYPSIIRIRLN